MANGVHGGILLLMGNRLAPPGSKNEAWDGAWRASARQTARGDAH